MEQKKSYNYDLMREDVKKHFTLLTQELWKLSADREQLRLLDNCNRSLNKLTDMFIDRIEYLEKDFK